MIEMIAVNYLKSVLIDIPVSAEKRPDMKPPFVIVEKTGSSKRNHIAQATLAFQSYGASMYEAAKLNDTIKPLIEQMIKLPNVSKAALNSDYNWTDTSEKLYRYQAVFDVTYMEVDYNVE